MKHRFAERAAVLLTALTVMMIIASMCFIAVEAHHDCCGEDCRICALIIGCDGIIRRIGLRAGMLLFCLPASVVFLSMLMQEICFCSTHTPVTAKVRINS